MMFVASDGIQLVFRFSVDDLHLRTTDLPGASTPEAGYIATVMRSRNAHRFAGKSNSSSANSFVDPPFEFWALGQWELYRPYIWYRRHRYLQFRFLKWTLIRVEVNLDQIVVLPHCQMVHFPHECPGHRRVCCSSGKW